MERIISPLKLDGHGADVANLQDALLLLIDNGIIQPSAAECRAYINGLSQELHD
jgi:hypothetical protein